MKTTHLVAAAAAAVGIYAMAGAASAAPVTADALVLKDTASAGSTVEKAYYYRRYYRPRYYGFYYRPRYYRRFY